MNLFEELESFQKLKGFLMDISFPAIAFATE